MRTQNEEIKYRTAHTTEKTATTVRKNTPHVQPRTFTPQVQSHHRYKNTTPRGGEPVAWNWKKSHSKGGKKRGRNATREGQLLHLLKDCAISNRFILVSINGVSQVGVRGVLRKETRNVKENTNVFPHHTDSPQAFQAHICTQRDNKLEPPKTKTCWNGGSATVVTTTGSQIQYYQTLSTQRNTYSCNIQSQPHKIIQRSDPPHATTPAYIPQANINLSRNDTQCTPPKIIPNDNNKNMRQPLIGEEA